MGTKTIKTIIQLRRNTEEYFELIKDIYIPLKGEVVLVDTTSDGLRPKVGDGTKTYGELGFADQTVRDISSGIIVRGYYYNGVFYADSEHTETYIGYPYKLYIDIPNMHIYLYDNENSKYNRLDDIPMATSETSGILKLYNTIGDNEDGTMTQKSIKTEIGKKFEVSAGEDETLIFTK